MVCQLTHFVPLSKQPVNAPHRFSQLAAPLQLAMIATGLFSAIALSFPATAADVVVDAVPDRPSPPTSTLAAQPEAVQTPPSRPAIAPAEMVVAQEFSSQTPASTTASTQTASTQATSTAANTTPLPPDAQYYRDYQSVVVPTEPVVQSVPAARSAPPAPTPISTTTPRQPTQTAQAAPPTVQVPPPPPLPTTPPPPVTPTPQQTATPPPTTNQPGWMVPVPAVTNQPVTVPPPPTGLPQSSSVVPTGELAVQATDVQIVGVDPDIQTFGLQSIQTKPGSQTSTSVLQEDVEILLKTGFFSSVTVGTQPNPQGVSVTFYTAPNRLQALDLSNAKALSLSVANSIFRDQFGQPISPAKLNNSVQAINKWYADNGYTLARVISLRPTRQGIVVVDVAEGVVGEVKLRYLNREGSPVDDKGNPIRGRSQEEFVRRQLETKPGQPFQTKTAQEDLQRLSALGIFEQAYVSFEGDARNTTVVYNLAERAPRDLRFGGGFNDSAGLFATVSVQDNNFGGLGQQLGGTVLLGTKDIQFDGRFVSPYRATEPNVPGYNANVFRRQGLSAVFDEDVKLANGDRVRERRYGAGVGIEKPIGGGWQGFWGLNYENVSTRDSGGDIFTQDRLGNPLTLSGEGVDDLFSFSFTALNDLRNNPVNPSSGSLTRFNTEQYIPIGRGNVFGTKLQGSYTQFFPVKLITASHKTPPDPRNSQPETFGINVRGGTYVGDLPPYNAFILGGPNSVRGWDNGDIATSRSFVEAQAEYRFPIYRFIGGAAFVDFASDLGSSDDVLGEPGVVRGKPGSGVGVGFGLRVNSPFGLVRGDLGFSNQGDVKFQFGFGQRF